MEIVIVGEVKDLAEALKKANIIDDYKISEHITTLIINQDFAEIKFEDFRNALQNIPEQEVKVLWRSIWRGVKNGRVKKLTNDMVRVELKKDKFVGITIPSELHERIKERAKNDGTTVNEVVLAALRKYIYKK